MKQRIACRLGRMQSLLLAILMAAGAVFAALPALQVNAAADSTETAGTTIDFDETIMLSVFWPPTQDYINDEQYKLMADAGINWVLGAGEETLATAANQKKMLELCEKYGMHLILQDGTFGSSLLGKSSAAVKSQVNRYTDYSSLGGFYILDEPYNPNNYVEAYLNLKKAFPNGYMHLNFLPSGSYGTDTLYKAQMNDWCRLCAAGGYPVDYLIYDRYPFGLSAGSMDRTGFYSNMRAVHDVALKNGVRTGTYIQTVCQSVAFRRPTDSEIRYEMYSALAFGFKQLSFFTWFTPVNRSEPFEDGIISADGVPNEHYETVKTINQEILTIGPILAKCDALEVYLNGVTWGQPSIPDTFFAQPLKKNQLYTVSFLRHKETGRNYLMVVNNSYSKKATVNLKLDSAITELYEVSRSDGSYLPVTVTDNTVELNLAAGDAVLLALPEGLDYYKPETGQPDTDVNLAADALITCSQSPGEGGYYMAYLNDGERFSDGTTMGWRSKNNDSPEIVIDLGRSMQFNRIDLYPEGTLFTYGDSFPESFTISVSDDGQNYTQAASVSDAADDAACSVRLTESAEARYIKISITKCRGDFAGFAEIEVYNDDGSLPDPEKNSFLETGAVYDYTAGENIALNKPVYPSSTTPEAGYRSWGWAADFINNGVDGQGWTSNVKQNTSPDSTEYIVIDFGDTYAVDEVIVKTLGCFPEEYRIELSTDGKEWTILAMETDAPQYENGKELVYTPEDGQPIAGRFLRFIGTRLRGTSADGYMLQLGNISAYGTPICDESVLTDAMNTYRSAGGDTSVSEYTACESALKKEFLTQSRADACAEALLALIVTEEETTAVQDEATAEPATETQTETASADESDSNADTESRTADEPGTNSSEAETGGEKTGCSSALSAVSATIFGGLCALPFLCKGKRKKKENG